MALEGSIKDFSVVDILQLISMQKKAGILSLNNDQEEIFISFIHGNIVHAFSGDEDEQMSNALIMAEKITITQMRAALRMTQKGISLGQIFVKFDYLSFEELKKWNQTLTQETIFSILSWESGRYRFDSEAVSSNMDCYLPISVERVLMEGMHQQDEWPLLLSKIASRSIVFEEVLQPIGGADSYLSDEAVRASDQTNPEITAPSLEMLEMEEHLWLLKWIDGTRTVDQVIHHAGVGAFPVYKCLVELLAIGRIKEKAWKTEVRKKPFSLISFRQILFHRFVLNGLLIAVTLSLLPTLFIPSFYGRESILQKNKVFLEQIRGYTTVNQKDIIQFSLNLYYLKHGHYPISLKKMAEDNVFQEEVVKVKLNDFHYKSYENGTRFNLIALNEITK